MSNFDVDAYLGASTQNPGASGGKGFDVDSYIGSQASQPQASASTAVPPVMRAPKAQNSPSAWDQLTRQIGLTARAGVTGVSAIPNMIGDALNSGINLGIRGINSIAGSSIPQLQMPSQVTQQGMNALGIPQPQNATERVVQDVASSMAGVSPSVALGNTLAKAASPVAAAVGRNLAALPGMQITGAAGSGAGSGIARENGAGPIGQIGSGFFGGAIGAIAPSAALGAGRAIAAVPENIRGAVQPFTNPQAYVGNQLASKLGPDAADIAANIRNAPEFVPGSMPTTAQAGANPTLVATEKALANTSPDFKIGLANREAENNAARWNALGEIAQTQLDLKNSIANRDNAVSTLYNI
ncbi:MAG: hypothetical protein KGJ45_12160, partial [Elusimicrobia bacterium]|nr:hypothetical protein [Elusimicrobiota bacterium]